MGILGVGLVNDDMASHLIIADYVTDPAGTVPSFVKGGYPIGPHAVVAAVATGTGVGLVEAFAGLTLVARRDPRAARARASSPTCRAAAGSSAPA